MNLFKRCACLEPSKCDHAYWFRFRLHGDECRRTTRCANRTQAQRIAATRQAAVLEGREGIRRDRGVRLSEHIDGYTAHTEKTNRTSYKDAAVLARLLKEVGERRLKEVSPFHLEKWKAARAKEVSQATVNRELNIVRGCFSRALDWRRLAVSPARTVKPYRVDNLRLRILSDAEVTTVLDACSPDLRLIARVTLESLMRLSEVLRLRVHDVGSNYATVVQSKSGRSRRVPITDELRTDLLARAHGGSGFVFGIGKEWTPPTQAAVSVQYSRLMTAIKMPGVSHHVFRHTGASNMLRDRASPRAVQLIGGWTTLRMVERYCHVTDEELHRAVGLASKHAAGTNAGTASEQPAEAESA